MSARRSTRAASRVAASQAATGVSRGGSPRNVLMDDKVTSYTNSYGTGIALMPRGLNYSRYQQHENLADIIESVVEPATYQRQGANDDTASQFSEASRATNGRNYPQSAAKGRSRARTTDDDSSTDGVPTNTHSFNNESEVFDDATFTNENASFGNGHRPSSSYAPPPSVPTPATKRTSTDQTNAKTSGTDKPTPNTGSNGTLKTPHNQKTHDGTDQTYLRTHSPNETGPHNQKTHGGGAQTFNSARSPNETRPFSAFDADASMLSLKRLLSSKLFWAVFAALCLLGGHYLVGSPVGATGKNMSLPWNPLSSWGSHTVSAPDGRELVDLEKRVAALEYELATVKSHSDVDRASLQKDFRQLRSELEAAIAKRKEATGSKTGLGPQRFNFFSFSAGAVIEPGLTSPTYDAEIPSWEKWAPQRVARALRPRVLPNPPSEALARWYEAGDCWCSPVIGGPPISLGIVASDLVYPDEVVIEHIARKATLDPGSAPRDMELWAKIEGTPEDIEYVARYSLRMFPAVEGREDPLHALKENWYQIGAWTYGGINGEPEAFDLTVPLKKLRVPAQHYIVRAATNHGADHTCLYRVLLHGEVFQAAADSQSA